jgi:hypothetical protein
MTDTVEAQKLFKTNMFHLSKLIILVKPMAVSRKKEKYISTLHAMIV